MAIIRSFVLTELQAATVRGEYENGSALDPALMNNKTAMLAAGSPYDAWGGATDYYQLPYRVVLDPDFASVASYLLAIPDYLLNTTIIFLPEE